MTYTPSLDNSCVQARAGEEPVNRRKVRGELRRPGKKVRGAQGASPECRPLQWEQLILLFHPVLHVWTLQVSHPGSPLSPGKIRTAGLHGLLDGSTSWCRTAPVRQYKWPELPKPGAPAARAAAAWGQSGHGAEGEQVRKRRVSWPGPEQRGWSRSRVGS